MRSDAIRDRLVHDPFQPFRLVLSSGAHYDVRDPRLVMPLKNGVFIAFKDGERWTVVPYLHIAALELLPNGKRSSGRRRRS
jgi:hypothetical protein